MSLSYYFFKLLPVAVEVAAAALSETVLLVADLLPLDLGGLAWLCCRAAADEPTLASSSINTIQPRSASTDGLLFHLAL